MFLLSSLFVMSRNCLTFPSFSFCVVLIDCLKCNRVKNSAQRLSPVRLCRIYPPYQLYTLVVAPDLVNIAGQSFLITIVSYSTMIIVLYATENAYLPTNTTWSKRLCGTLRERLIGQANSTPDRLTLKHQFFLFHSPRRNQCTCSIFIVWSKWSFD